MIDGVPRGPQDSSVLIFYPTGFPDGPDPYLVLATAWLLDALVGDPVWLYRRVPHPVVLLGRAIGRLERTFNNPDRSAAARRWRGAGLVLLIVCSSAAFGWLLGWGLRAAAVEWMWLVEALMVSALLAYRSLYDHVRAVATGLDGSIAEGRRAVGHIVGRDPAVLDGAGVARAAIESAAENFSDGVVAPLLFYVLFGLPGLFAYKAINTLDSMIGYRDEQYAEFGWMAARLDDCVNWPAARLSGTFMVLAAACLPGFRAGAAIRAMLRDASKHRSPNAGWPEAAAAGALGLSLAGPRVYGSHRVQDSWMGDGRPDATAADIRRALRLYVVAASISIVAGCIALIP